MIKSETVKMKLGGKPFTLGIKKQINVKAIPHIYLILAVLLINILSVIFIIVFSKNLPPQMPLNYGLPRGERQLVAPIALVLPILLSSFFIAVNSIFTLFVKSPFLKNVLVISGIFISVLSSITVVRIIMTITGL